MGLFNDWLNTPAKRKDPNRSPQFKEDKKEEDTKADPEPQESPNEASKSDGEEFKRDEPKDKISATMAEGPYVITLDGEPPNGAVPPGRLLMTAPLVADDPPNGGLVPANYLNAQGAPFASYMPSSAQPCAPPFLPVSALQQHVMPAASVTFSNGLFLGTHQSSNEQVPHIYTHYHADTHHHVHNHYNDAYRGAANSVAQIAPPQPTPETHTWIKFIRNNVRPCQPYPRPFTGQMYMGNYIMAKTTTMREFLTSLDVPQATGYGVQQVYHTGDNRWGPGEIFSWGVGEQTRTLDGEVLGKGIEGHEIFVCAWRAN